MKKLMLACLMAFMVAGCAHLPDWFPGAGPGAPPKWDRTTLASCWDGPNAQTRYMNILSPNMSEGAFKEALKWQEARGCNTLHLFLNNYRNGGYAGYSVYGPTWSGVKHSATIKLFKKRIAAAREAGFAYVPWMVADDSAPFAARPEEEWIESYKLCKAEGLFADASYVVLGLELNEYWKADRVARLAKALREISGLKVGIHMTSGQVSYAPFGDIFLYQVNPGLSAAQIAQQTALALKTGKPVVFFELERYPARHLCEVALGTGAFAVGNW